MPQKPSGRAISGRPSKPTFLPKYISRICLLLKMLKIIMSHVSSNNEGEDRL